MPSETELAGIARYEREEAAFTASGLALAHEELLSIGSMKRAIHESRAWTVTSNRPPFALASPIA
jgi:hypothetical protein